jgi:DtxR family manganese transport transcriptional regulator
MPAPESQARQHARVREAHETELIEDYLELIGDLQQAHGEARAADLARRLGVSHATVHNMLRRLLDRGLVTKEPYRAIFLTDAGARMAADSRARHDVVLGFLRAAGVSEATAQQDAEGIEHHVSDETLHVLQGLAERLRRT